MIPSSVKSSLTSLLAAVNAAYPLATASVATLASLQQQANGLTVIIDSALFADDSAIEPPILTVSGAATFAMEITELVSVAQEEAALAQLAGLVGRTAVNIANAGV